MNVIYARDLRSMANGEILCSIEVAVRVLAERNLTVEDKEHILVILREIVDVLLRG